MAIRPNRKPGGVLARLALVLQPRAGHAFRASAGRGPEDRNNTSPPYNLAACTCIQSWFFDGPRLSQPSRSQIVHQPRYSGRASFAVAAPLQLVEIRVPIERDGPGLRRQSARPEHRPAVIAAAEAVEAGLIPTSDELFRARAITGISDGSNFAASGYGGDVSREQIAASLVHALPVLATMKERLPEAYAAIVDDYYDGYVIGQTETEIVAASRANFRLVVTANLPLADDDVLVDYGKLVADQYAALGAKSPTLCYLYVSGPEGAQTVKTELPSDLIQREFTLSERVVATAAKRQFVPKDVSNPLWEKVAVEIAKRIGAEKLALLRERMPDVSSYSDYCGVWTALYQEVTNLEEHEAGTLMRQLLNDR